MAVYQADRDRRPRNLGEPLQIMFIPGKPVLCTRCRFATAQRSRLRLCTDKSSAFCISSRAERPMFLSFI